MQTMKIYMFRNVLATMAIVLTISSLQAQFDDVYYDPEQFDPTVQYTYPEDEMVYDSSEAGVTYYDNEAYDDFEDYDYYYSSRIKRFYHPYAGFGFYDPVFVNYNYYDPYAWDYYSYPASGIYVNVGFGFGFSFGFGSYWNNWYYPPYYGYNSWYNPYYGGGYYGGYYGCNSYYNPYYGNCGGGYYGGGWDNHHGGYDDHHGGGDHYYGPRVTGNTGSSPRGPAVPPGISTPVREAEVAVNESMDHPVGKPEIATPGRANPSGPVVNGGTEQTPGSNPTTRNDNEPVVAGGTEQTPGSTPVTRGTGVTDAPKQIPVDREITQDAPRSTPSGRPVFKPYTEQKFQPYPGSGRSNPTTQEPVADNKPGYRPYTPPSKPSVTPKDNLRSSPQAERPNPAPAPGSQQSPAYTPPTRSNQERPAYTPPTRSNQERPSYTPPPTRSGDKPAQTQPSRSSDKPSYSPPPRENNESRSNDRPSYSPPPRGDSQRSSSPSHSPSPSSSGRSGGGSSGGGNSSGGSSHSSGGSHSSPRGGG